MLVLAVEIAAPAFESQELFYITRMISLTVCETLAATVCSR